MIVAAKELGDLPTNDQFEKLVRQRIQVNFLELVATETTVTITGRVPSFYAKQMVQETLRGFVRCDQQIANKVVVTS